MHFRNGALEVSDANLVICASRYLLGSIIHSVELSDFVGESDFFKQCFNFFTRSRLSEVVLRDTLLRVVRWEK